jgi:arylformamidase
MSEVISFTRPALSPALIEREYNNRGLVPEYPQYLERWVGESKLARETRSFTTHRFGAQPNSTLDLFTPHHAEALLVFIHGGYWRALTKDEFSFVAPAYVSRRIAVAVLNYDLCPTTTIAGIIDQVVAAMHYLHRIPNIPKRWLVAGHSAGGHLTATMWSALAKLSTEVRQAIVGGITLSGVHDLDPMVDYSINADLKLTREEAHRLSPVGLAPRIHAPLIVAAGDNESSEFKRQAKLLYDLWPSACQAPRAGLILPPGLNHFSIVEKFADPAHDLHKRTIGLLDVRTA